MLHCIFHMFSYTQQLNYLLPVNISFHINVKSSQAAKIVESRIISKVINSILFIDKFENKCVVLKGMLQSLRLKYHTNTISFDQSVRNRSSFEYKCFNNIKRDINMLVSVITNKHFKIFLRLLCFLPKKK